MNYDYSRVFLERTMRRGFSVVQRTQSNGILSNLSCRYSTVQYIPREHVPKFDNRRTFSVQSEKSDSMPLRGVRVLELGQLVAGPFAGQLLG